MSVEVMGLILLGLFGLIVGSFLNVVILRHNTGKSLGGRSMCMSCSKELSVKELIPVVSYILQAGKCLKCKSKISKQYIVVEIATSILFVLSGISFLYGDNINYISFLLILTAMSLLVILAAYDFKHMILPDIYVYLFVSVAVLHAWVTYLNAFQFGWQLMGGIISALPAYALWFFSRGSAMGFGDVKLSLGMGIFLGVYLGISAIWYAFVLGAIYGIFLMAFGKAEYKSRIAFGPFLVLGFLITFFTQVGFIEIVNMILFL